jgi:hypothetical protein
MPLSQSEIRGAVYLPHWVMCSLDSPVEKEMRISILRFKFGLGEVAQSHNFKYLGGKNQEDCGRSWLGQKGDPI